MRSIVAGQVKARALLRRGALTDFEGAEPERGDASHLRGQNTGVDLAEVDLRHLLAEPERVELQVARDRQPDAPRRNREGGGFVAEVETGAEARDDRRRAAGHRFEDRHGETFGAVGKTPAWHER